MPPISTLETLQDLIQHLSDYSGGDGIDRDLRDYRQAAHNAYRDLTLDNEWKAYLTRGRINFNPAQDDGTIDVDVTGGAYERQVTLTGSTWPTWAAYGTLLIDGVRYKVDERKSSTVLTLTYDSCPTVDVTAGTSYVLYQNIYPLPEDFRRLNDLHFENGLGCLQALSGGVPEWLTMDQQEAVSGRPYVYAIGGSQETWQYGKMSLYVHPYPVDAESIDFIYWRNPRQIRYTGYGANDRVGTVTGTAGSAAIVGASTAFNARMIGSLIRFSENTTTHPEGLGGLNPYSEQRVITAVTDATHLTIDEPLSYSYAAVKYVITDPLDADGALLMALYRYAERELDNFRKPANVAQRTALCQLAYGQAMERDQRLVPTLGLYNSLWQFGGGTLIVSSEDDDDDTPPSGGDDVPDLLFSQTEIKTVSNTVTETALSGTGEGSLTLAANSWAVGDAIRVRASGTYGSNPTLPGTLKLRLKWGSAITQLFQITLPDNQSGKTWSIDSTLSRHSVGAGGTVSGGGFLLYAVTGELAPYNAEDPVANEVCDTTVTQTISLTAEFSLADTDNTITCSQLTVEQETTA